MRAAANYDARRYAVLSGCHSSLLTCPRIFGHPLCHRQVFILSPSAYSPEDTYPALYFSHIASFICVSQQRMPQKPQKPRQVPRRGEERFCIVIERVRVRPAFNQRPVCSIAEYNGVKKPLFSPSGGARDMPFLEWTTIAGMSDSPQA